MVMFNVVSLQERAPWLRELGSITLHFKEKNPRVESGERAEGSGFLFS